MPWVYWVHLNLKKDGLQLAVDYLWTNKWPSDSDVIRVRNTEAGIGKNGFGGRAIPNKGVYGTQVEAEKAAKKLATETIKKLQIWL